MGYSNYYRHPHTQNEMKQFFASAVNELDIPVKVRGRRRPKYLPCAWDDLYRSNMSLRNWKSYRKAQWKD
ncbi:hypothetical protein ACFSJ3_10855 [Corallincola platygyrae]|uniref:Uncharacterized protein n=1 Tax=Corallincola platygyrae TaxID=1193278 RepID=A0ABW4XN61_9GAMM